MLAIYKREMRGYFTTWTGYIFLAVSICLSAFIFSLSTLLNATSELSGYFAIIVYGMVVFLPILTMKSFSEERKLKTEQLLMTAPISSWQMVLGKYLSAITMLGIYLALIVVNCIILGRAEMYARKNSILNSLLDGVGMGLGFLGALLIIAIVREVFGNGSFADIPLSFMEPFKIPILTQAPGGFLVFGLVIALMNRLTAKRGGVKRKSFDCEGCPTANICKGAGCNGNEKKEDK